MVLPSRILVCGGREYKDFKALCAEMDTLSQWFAPEFVLIHGGARGADMLAHQWAFFRGCPVIRMDANWDFYDRKAGPIRNRWMLKWANPDLVIAFPGGIGTASMISIAKDAGVVTHEIR